MFFESDISFFKVVVVLSNTFQEMGGGQRNPKEAFSLAWHVILTASFSFFLQFNQTYWCQICDINWFIFLR